MPTVELISVDCSEVPKLPVYSSFAHRAETRLISHRALFQPVFDLFTGVIVHLGNKDQENEANGFFAGRLMNWETDNVVEFAPEPRREVFDLMTVLMRASPEQHITFSTDYQLGGEMAEGGEVSLPKFFDLHDAGRIRYNTLWHVRGASS